jgi:hypothetical protein
MRTEWAHEHLEWIGYGDAYERECSGTLSEELESILLKAKEAIK